MRKKTVRNVMIGYVVYGILVWLYLFHFAPTGVPYEYVGTAADPTTFMTRQQLETSIQFARTRHLIFFLSSPFYWLIIFRFIFGGMSEHFEEVVKTRISNHFLQVLVYYFMFASITFIALLPFRFFSYQLARFHGTSLMTLPHWLRNRGIDFVVDFLLMLLLIQVVMFLIRAFKKKWWLVTWVLFIPFAFFFMLIQPILIDPLYRDFQPLQNAGLEEKILEMAEEAGVAADRVFEVVMSGQTSTINGYVTGVGPTARIVLWDTALEQLSENEILFLMAHEIAHYVNRDIYLGIGVALVVALGALYVVDKVLNKVDKDSFARIPVAIVTVSILLFLLSPATNLISRRLEARADAFALEMTGDPEAGISLFQTFARTSLNEVHPPVVVRVIRSTHPSLFERMVVLIDE
ncbi:MAG: M48 family metallopeptidase [Turicibacter sp.]|nr:M48 family metallopeptidase [Turicibacter sp.]